MNQVTQFNTDFNGRTLSVIDHESKRWMTAEQVGLALGYDPANARKGVLKLYQRHADEFTDEDTCVVKLTTQVQARDMRLFSATGCNMLGMFANTSLAKEFRIWAKRVLAGQQPLPHPKTTEERVDRLENAMQEMAGSISHMARGVDAVLTQMNVTGRYIAMLEMNQRGTVRITPEIVDQVHLLAAEGMPQADIARLLRVSRTSVWKIVHGQYPQTRRLQEASEPNVADLLENMVQARRAALVKKLSA